MISFINHLIRIFVNINKNLKHKGKIIKKNTIFQHINIIKPPLVPVFISSVIQFDKFFYLVVPYENYLIYIFMNINEKFSNERKNLRKVKGCTYKITNVSPTMCFSVSNLCMFSYGEGDSFME